AREPDMKSSRQKETVAGLNADIDNIRSAWDTAVAYEALDRLHTAAFSLWYFYNLRDSLQEGEQAFESATERLQTRLAASESDQAAPDRARLAGTLGELLSHQAQFTFRQGRIGEAAALYETSLTLLRPLDEPAALAQALNYRGVVYWLTGQFEEAWPYLNESLAMAQMLGDEWGQVQSLGFMGMIAQAQGDHDRAYHYLSESLARSRVMGDIRLISFIGSHLAHTLQALGRVSEGLGLLRENLRLAIDTTDRLGIGVTLEQMAIATQAGGNEAEARRLLAESIDQFRDVGDTWFLSRTLTLAGYLALAVGEADQAYDLFRQAGQVAVATQALPNILAALAGLAEWSARGGQSERALEIVLHILRHPAGTQDVKDRADTLRTELEEQLTPQQVAAVQDRVQAGDFEAMRQDVLG
ncbi:MAG: tetratricopeptide repeat protein, partial [Anaerolineae bacterium]|nr:tetratricopeptide repeat protein [Anaerolineae bacterium]